ncbi:hypothetical protein GCM10009663_61740 [Kitasatospora arboriphila]|uniref:Uncharacterized protein n=1 Tax=Kitasatospora arboriphila TaxID=258052 RepID=A0ABN1U1I6_9ACTN
MTAFGPDSAAPEGSWTIRTISAQSSQVPAGDPAYGDAGTATSVPPTGIRCRPAARLRNVEHNTAVNDGRTPSADSLAVPAKHRWQRNFYS